MFSRVETLQVLFCGLLRRRYHIRKQSITSLIIGNQLNLWLPSFFRGWGLVTWGGQFSLPALTALGLTCADTPVHKSVKAFPKTQPEVHDVIPCPSLSKERNWKQQSAECQYLLCFQPGCRRGCRSDVILQCDYAPRALLPPYLLGYDGLNVLKLTTG